MSTPRGRVGGWRGWGGWICMMVAAVLPAAASAQCTPVILSRTGGRPDQIVVRSNVGYAAFPGELRVLDLTNASNPVVIGSVYFAGTALELELDGGELYIAAGSDGLVIVDISAPTSPAVIATLGFPCDDVAVSGGTAFACSNGRLKVVDVTTPAAPVVRSTVTPPSGSASHVASDGGTAYVGVPTQVYSYDATNRASPVLLGSTSASSLVVDMAVRGNTLLVASFNGAQLIDVSNPSVLNTVSSIASTTIVDAATLWQSGGATLLAMERDTCDLAIYDVTASATPVFRSTIAGVCPRDVDGAGTRLYVMNSVAIQSYDVTNPALPVSLFVSVRQPDFPQGVGVVGPNLIVANGEDLLTYGIANPSAPSLLGTFATSRSVLAFEVAGTTGYVGDLDGFVKVVRLINPAAPVVLGSLRIGDTVYRLLVSGTMVYAVVFDFATSYTLVAVDVSNPAAPTVAGTLSGITLTPYTDMATDGRLLYLGDGGYRVVDVTDPAQMRLVHRYLDSGSAIYQGLALHPDGRTLYVIEGDRVNIYNMSDPENAALIGGFAVTGAAHLRMQDSLLMVSEFAGELSFVDCASPASPVLLGSVNVGSALDQYAFRQSTLWGAAGGSGFWGIRVPALPRVVTQPSPALRCGTDPVQFSVGWASSTAPSFQWRRNGVNIADGPTGTGSTISGATTAALTISNSGVADLAFYSVEVSNTCGSVTTGGAAIVPALPVTVVVQPPDSIACPTGSAQFDFGFLGTLPASFQWEAEFPIGSGTFVPLVDGSSASVTVSGATARHLTISANAGRVLPPVVVTRYRCVASNLCGSTTTAAASLRVCRQDFNCDGEINADDLGDYITCYFSAPPCAGAEFNDDGNVNADDLGDFITLYFSGSC